MARLAPSTTRAPFDPVLLPVFADFQTICPRPGAHAWTKTQGTFPSSSWFSNGARDTPSTNPLPALSTGQPWPVLSICLVYSHHPSSLYKAIVEKAPLVHNRTAFYK